VSAAAAVAEQTTPAPGAPAEAQRWDRRRAFALVFAAAVYVFLYAPIVVMAVFSFNEGAVQSLPLKGFSTVWYERLANDAAMTDALIYSAKVSLFAVVISTIAGTAFALLFVRVKIKGRRVLQALIALPFVMPGMVLGIALLLAFRQVGIQPGMLAIVVAHVTFITPVVMFVVMQRLEALDHALEQAAMDLGAGPIRTFAYVVFPSIRTALIAAALLGFTVSFDEVIVTFFVSGSEQTLPVHIWTLLRQGFSPVVNAILTIIAVVSVALITVAMVVIARPRKGAA
jgi:spermidine/putrescine transport system permease protein